MAERACPDRVAHPSTPPGLALASVPGSYLVALLAVVLACLLRLGLEAFVGEGLPMFITFYPAVVMAALFGGWGPGLMATLLVLLGVAYGMMPPAGLAVSALVDRFSLGLFLLMSLAIMVATQLYRNLRIKAAAYDHEADTRAERATFELALRQSEERYRLLVEQIADGIFVSDRQGRYLDVNTAGTQLLGYSRDEILARHIVDIVSPEECGRLPREIDELADGAVTTSQWRFQRKDGSTFFGEVVARQLPDGRLLGVLRDISANRRLEIERMQERALLNGIAANTDVMLVYLDARFNFVWVNQAYLDGCQTTRESLIGKNHFALYPDADNEAIFCRVRDTGEAVFFKDKPFVFPDQPERGITYWDWSLAPDKDALGRLIGLVFSLRETTLYVRAQSAVRESEGRFAALADAAPVFIWMSGPDKTCSWFNQQWLDFTGRSLAQELNNGWMEGVHPDDLERCLATYSDSFDRRETFKMDYRHRSANGEYRWLSDQAAPYFSPDGEFMGYIGTAIDITERRLVEQALGAAQAFAEGTLDAISAHLCVVDRNGRILAVNQAWRDFLDQQGGEPAVPDYGIGSRYTDIGDLLPVPGPTQMDTMAVGIRQVINGESDEFSYEFSCPGPAGLRWFVATVTRFRGDSGYIVVAHENVTERKRAEDAAKAAEARAVFANNAKSRFLAAASHDLRQPLSALGIYVGVLKDSVSAADRPIVDNMADCIASLSNLLADLLDISKLEAGVVTPALGEFPVADMLTSLVAVHAPEAMLKGLHLRAVGTRRYAHTDPVIYQRILGNLIANAIRYTEQGGVLVGCRRYRGKHWVEVWDSGIGFPEDKTAEIFEEFRQLDHDARNRGSGLGLAIVAKSAALLGLEIRVRSRPGRGSMFALELPLGEPGVALKIEAPETRPLHIALVDDNLQVLHSMIVALEGMGHQVTAASSGVELFEQLGNARPDIVVSDFRLGHRITGFDVIEDARAVYGEELPALLITGDTDPRLIRSMADRGILVQHKPLRVDTLQACIGQATNRRMSA